MLVCLLVFACGSFQFIVVITRKDAMEHKTKIEH
jgi:hypothetical protein